MTTSDRIPGRTASERVVSGHQTFVYDGVRIAVSPDFWLRRLLRFPFFFENTNPTFRVDLERIKEAAKAGATFLPQFTVLDGSGRVRQLLSEDGLLRKALTIPTLTVGQKTRIRIPSVYGISGTTNTLILALSPDGAEHLQLYWYPVKDEANLWLILAVGILTVFGALVTLGVQKLLDLLASPT